MALKNLNSMFNGSFYFLKKLKENSKINYQKLKESTLFEISWEVGNKVGGIHTVIYSKIPFSKKHFKNFFLIGPFFKNKDYSKEIEFIENDQLLNAINNKINKKYGFEIKYGKLKNYEDVKIILIDYMNYSYKTNEIKGKIWEIGKVDSLGSNWYDFDEVMLWSWTTGIFLKIYKETSDESTDKLIAHFHEWMSGGGIFYLKRYHPEFKTVFTTHSTVLGRALSYNGENLYNIEHYIDPDKKAEKLGIKTKHQTEKAIAKLADKFTTVSEITGEEVELFLKKRPDNILYNGFYSENINFLQDINLLYKSVKERWIEHLNKYFNRYFQININKHSLIFISGRNEIRSKGVDIFIKSLGKLNRFCKNTYNKNRFRKDGVIALFLIVLGDFKKREENFEFKVDNIPYSEFEIGENEIFKLFIENGLLNRKEDFVKVQLVPIYLQNEDNYLNMDYYDAISGLDYGFFPSYYEPWGYTPLETSYFGVKGFTTDLTGFGKFILKKTPHLSDLVIRRAGLEDEKVSESIFEKLTEILNKTENQFYNEKKKIFKESKLFSWENLYKYYLKCYTELLKNN